MIFLQIAGGVALMLFAVRFLRKALDRLFGQHLMVWIEQMTSHRLKAFGAGIFMGAIAPSSTALSIMLVQLLTASELSAARTLAILLGANVGITVLVQLLSVSISGLAAGFILVGVIGFQGLQRNLFRGLGQCFLSLGFIFLAMQMISQGASLLNPTGDFAAFMRLLQGHPIAVLLSSALLAFLLQSSTATIALGIGFSLSGHFGMALMIPWILGTNLGIAGTALLAGWRLLEARRLAVANLLVKGAAATVILALFTPAILHWLANSGLAEAQQSANFHTAFNLAVALLTLPFLTPLARLVEKMILPEAAISARVALPHTFLDPAAAETPAFALAQATRELLAMGDEVKSMLQTWWRGFSNGDLALLALASDHDRGVDTTYHEIKRFLSLISEQPATDYDHHWHLTLLTFSNDLEDIGDIISTDLCPMARKQIDYGTILAPLDRADLAELYRRIVARYDIAMSILTTRDAALAQTFLIGKEAVDRWCRECEKQHYERLRAAEEAGLRSSSIFLEMLNDLRRINSHLTVIGYALHLPPSELAPPILPLTTTESLS